VWRLPVDTTLFDPLYYYSSNHSFRFEAQYLPTALNLISLRSRGIDDEALVQGTFDPYAFYRDVYRQQRIYRFYHGIPPTQFIQSMEGVDEVDVDRLLEEQKEYERKH
jgi:phospholipid-binding lipoprotein MlaA